MVALVVAGLALAYNQRVEASAMVVEMETGLAFGQVAGEQPAGFVQTWGAEVGHQIGFADTTDALSPDDLMDAEVVQLIGVAFADGH